MTTRRKKIDKDSKFTKTDDTTNQETFECHFCNKKYKKVETLTTHKCKIRDRLNFKGETYFRLAFLSFNIFYEWGFPRGKPKTEIDFIKSSYFDNFLEYGKFMVAVKINDLEKYTKFLLSNNVPIKHWCDESIYGTFVDRIIKSESPEVAVERTIITMEKWAAKNNKPFQNFFKEAEPSLILKSIKQGKVSPWVVYNTVTGKQFMKRLTPIHIQSLYGLIDPDFWSYEFKKHKNEVSAISAVLKSAGL